MDLIAEQESMQPQQRKKWAKFLDSFGAPCICHFIFPPSSGRLMVSYAIWHVS